ncbi:MAG: 30S ribosomal protein S17e [Aigarchaeota archaeon]|nr:30S ribosomal protein S17e [Aigarchaeota archaeon]MDW7986223.1 30S ribosomal protein S17e [Nitrososphaerota archaeon]
MGKIRIRKVKVLAKETMKTLEGKVAADFESNKLLVGQILTGRVSKKMRNKIAGYLTSIVKKELKKEEAKQKDQIKQ